jgi:WD40 repeat protein
VRSFDLGRPDADPVVLGTHEGTVKSVVWVDDTLGVSAGDDGLVKCVTVIRGPSARLTPSHRWWDLRAGQLATSTSFGGPITSMEISRATGQLVLTSGKTVAFVPTQPGAPAAHTLTLPYAPSSASVHPVLRDRFVTGSTADEWVRVHGLDGAERDVHKGHHGPVHCVEFSPDGEMFASGSGASLPRPRAAPPPLTLPPQRTVRARRLRARSTRRLMRALCFFFYRRDDPALADDAGEHVRALAGPARCRVKWVAWLLGRGVYCCIGYM